ncbi:MAG: TldD/PmbA family protein [Candidatus Micrarchaeota archaeon]|nr:TldD/PmbA family protein [Candidatus Micrarchaeota archaeon]
MDVDSIRKSLSSKPFFCDFRFLRLSSRTIGIKDGEEESREGAEEGISVRAFMNGSWGFASGPLSDFQALLARAERLALSGKGNSKYPLRESEISRPKKSVHFHPSETEKLIASCKSLYSEMEDEKIRNRQVRLSERLAHRAYLNSAGAHLEDEYLLLYSRFTCIGKDGAVTQEGHHTWGSREKWEEESLFSSAREAKRKCLGSLSASPPPSGTYTVILDNEMAGVFAHEAVGHACEGDAVQEGTSILGGKKGFLIGSDLVSIWDSPEVEGAFGSYSFDDEGMQGKAENLIQEGVLKGFLHSAESALSLGEAPNGHARAETFGVPPIVRMSNTYIERGDHDVDELLDVDEGIYVKGMNGGSVDTITGQFMFRAEEAFMIHKGVLGDPVRDLSITGTIIDTLKEVDAVGNDFHLKPGFCGKNGQTMHVSDGGPHIRVRSMKVG